MNAVVRVMSEEFCGVCIERNAADSSRVMRRMAPRPCRARSVFMASPFLPMLSDSNEP